MTATDATGAARKIRVAVIYGGRSNEHAISCVSAGSILVRQVGTSIHPGHNVGVAKAELF